MAAMSSTKTILVVDDSKSPLRTYEVLLKRYSTFTIEVRLANSGLEGLEKIREPPAVDLVLLDSDMPDMKGIEFLLQVKAQSTLRDIPVIVVSGEDSRTEMERALAAGAARYLIKPVGEPQLHAIIDETLAANPDAR